MPRGDGTGPLGQSPGTGRGMGTGFGLGRGRMGGRVLGPGGFCVCPNCGTPIEHHRGVPCNRVKCPQCGQPMIRNGGTA
jgi:hypothetical protein